MQISIATLSGERTPGAGPTPQPGAAPGNLWTAVAACAGMDPDIFHPHGKGNALYIRARAVCARCPVRAQCLAEALAVEVSRTGEYRHGMWGGLTPDERASLYRRSRWRAS